MAARSTNKQRTDIPEHAASLPSAAEEANVAEFSRLMQGLKAKNPDARPRRWISRIGALLRHVRADRGQREVAHTAGVTQPYLSRLENGLLPKRGPTIDVLFRCAEAMSCDIEILMRAKEDGELLGRVSSADLETQESPVKMDVVLETFRSRANERASPFAARTLNLVFEAKGTSALPVIWTMVRKADGRVGIERVDAPDAESGSIILNALKRANSLRAMRQPGIRKAGAGASTTEESTIKVGENDVIVIGKSE
jgi:transcriptional regulator with XRE-family HTH domain